MVRFLLIISFFCSSLSLLAQQQGLQPIGQWREHFPYQQTTGVIQGDRIYATTPYAVFAIDADNSVERYTKVTGLNSVDITTAAWDATTNQLVIAYASGSIDILKETTIRNLDDIRRSNISGDKTIQRIVCNNGLAYICTGLGIVVADLNRYEIRDTWIIGNNGVQTKVNGFAADNQFWYAATDEGVKRTPRNNNNPADFRTWQLINTGMGRGIVRQIVSVNNNIYALRRDSIYILNNNSFQFFYTDNSWPIVSLNTSNGKLLICQRTANGTSRVIQLSTTGSIERTLSQAGVISFPQQAIVENNNVWVADLFGGLSRFNNTVERFIPDGPLGTASGTMVFARDSLFIAAGSINDSWNYLYNRNGVYWYGNNQWSFKSTFKNSVLDSTLDFITAVPDPIENAWWAGSYGGGLVRFSGNNIRIFKQSNSTLQAANGDPGSYRVGGLAFDIDGNLWVSNYGALQNLHVRKPDGNWRGFSIPFSLLENAAGQIVVDDDRQVWIVSPKGNGLISYNPGNSVDNAGDDKWKRYLAGRGNGNLSSSNVLCIAKDKNGILWIGTDRGVNVIQCSNQVFNQGCEAIQPIIQTDQFAGLLFQDEMVQSIAVDGANRKWVATRNGVWLVSAEGDKVIHHFNAANSPLPDDDVRQLAINPSTGEVFMATFKGIVSYRSTATEGGTTTENVLVFPNPVPPDYQGSIAIRGLVNNATVKIAELNGRLVFQTRALGGQAIWNGKNYNGQAVASGIYLVLVRDEGGQEKIATKIVITRGR
jgi:hypothetical protein